MARVTKINVGGTNYDIAHEGELKNSGFEVVTSLPTTGLFEGREVMYNGKKYVYSSGWKEEITANTMYEANLLWGGRNISSGFSPVDAAMMSELSSNVIAFPNPEGISIEYSRDGGVTWLDYGATDAQKVNLFTSKGYYVCGKSSTTALGMLVRITITPAICGFYTSLNKLILYSYNFGSSKSWCTLKGLSSVNVNAGNEDDSFYSTIFEKERINGSPAYNVINFNQIYTAPEVNNRDNWFYRLRLVFGFDEVSNANIRPLVITQLRFFGIDRFTLPSNLAKYNHLYTYDWKQNALFPAKVESKEVINFDINNIEPTQTGNSVSKTSTWLWQYLVQGVNWLNANKVALSVYNTKVAELVQTDSDNNAYIQSVKEELTALIDEVSGGLPNLAAVARSGSYNDLTDTPTLAAVATSGDYNDLLNRPTFSGSYNDLTDTPNLATVATSGDYNDLSNLPTIPSSFADLSGNVVDEISDGSITNAKLANSSMTLNGITVSLGHSYALPWQISWNSTLYKARIMGNWLQIYHNNQWVDTFYLLRQEPIQPTNVTQITSLSDLSWYNEQVSEYEIDSNTTFKLLKGDVSIAAQLLQSQFTANQLTLNLYPIPSGSYNKGALDKVISDLKDNNFAVFVENDLDTILTSGSDFCVRIKISKVPTYKAIIECYVAR